MRKALHLLLAFILLGSICANAQPYSTVSHLTGTVNVAGTNVTVTQIGSVNSGNYCTTGPYQIGKTQANGYKYDFAGPITHARINFTRIHNDDTMKIIINEDNTIVLPAVTPYAACSLTTNNVNITNDTLVTTTGGATGTGQDGTLTLTITPNTITSLRVEHIRHPDNNIASDIYYSLEIADDSCSLGFDATVTQTQCSGSPISFDATVFPNTTYTWTGTSAQGIAAMSPSNNVRNPTIPSATVLHNGQYYVTGTRGVCTYRDTVSVTVSTSPSLGGLGITQDGPYCPGETDTVRAPSVSLPIGGRVYYYDSFGITLDSLDITHDKEWPNVQPIDAHRYFFYARDINGCISDTLAFDFQVNPAVTANFTFELKEGCLEDTVIFNDTSISTNDTVTAWNWRFGDGSTSMLEDPTHYYQVPKPDTQQRTYNVRLIADNGYCKDTIDRPVVVNHPIWVHFDIDDDSLCQGDSVTFTNNSFAKPGTQPFWFWDFRDGFTDTTFNTGHRYQNAGVYDATLYITDFRDCRDSFKRTIVVDSIGGIYFEVSEDEICVGEEVVFNGVFTAAGYNSIEWDFKDGISIPAQERVYHSYLLPGTYDVTFSADYRICPDTFFERTITVHDLPQIYIGDDTTICPNGSPILLQAVLQNSVDPSQVKYSWNTKTEDVTQDIYVRGPGEYSVTADLNGCTASDTIKVEKDCYIDIPNVFTPNGDGRGDYFLPRQLLSRSVTAFEMQIYNRWGEIVFETNSLNGRGWDGKYGGDDQPTGVYIYTINVSFANGITERYQGNVTLIR